MNGKKSLLLPAKNHLKMSYRITKRILVSCLTLLLWTVSLAQPQMRHWMVADGLPTGEVRQIIALPNRQMLVNCEGVFCISSGAGFSVVPCDRRKTFQLEHFLDSVGYGYQWQGDSLLWLRDFYRIYLFDIRTRAFCYDIDCRLASLGEFSSSPTSVTDWQGGTWTGTLADGIVYLPPERTMPVNVDNSDSLVAVARKVEKLDLLLADSRRLQSRGLNQIGYLMSNDNHFVSLNNRLPQLNHYRYIVGACAIGEPWVVLYTQNGACLLDTKVDTLATFTPAEVIGEYTDKYNCMLQGRDGTLWIGTQNGLFKTHPKLLPWREGSDYLCERVEGLANNCIRSLVADHEGNIWVGTAQGISKIEKLSPPNGGSRRGASTVINYGEDDGIPPVSMMERAACMTDDGRLVFVHHNSTATVFRPEWLDDEASPCEPVLTTLLVNGQPEPSTPSSTNLLRPLSFDENYLTFQFSALDYAHPSHVRYRYRLCGLEEEWHTGSESGGLTVADYKALSPGDYVFEAQAASADGQWSDALTVPFTILPPWWLTWWAKLGYSLIALMGLMLLINYYLKRKRVALERENDERVNRLFELRDAARHQFAESTAIDPEKISANVEEEELVKRMLAAINENLDNEDYGVDQLARDVAMSRSSLYDKLRTMLGISPADFIRNVRLKHAAELLVNTQLSIAEVSERVGFNSPRIFSSNFKKMFGVLPSDYRSPKE